MSLKKQTDFTGAPCWVFFFLFPQWIELYI